MSISLLLYFVTMAQINGRYSSSIVVELPQSIATLSLIPVDCPICWSIIGTSWLSIFLWYCSPFFLSQNDLVYYSFLVHFCRSAVNLERWNEQSWEGVGSIPPWCIIFGLEMNFHELNQPKNGQNGDDIQCLTSFLQPCIKSLLPYQW